MDKIRLVLVKGNTNSRLLKKAVLISAPSLDSSGRSMYIVSDEMKKIFGEFSGKGSIQRSYARYVVPEYTNRAAEFVKSLI